MLKRIGLSANYNNDNDIVFDGDFLNEKLRP